MDPYNGNYESLFGDLLRIYSNGAVVRPEVENPINFIWHPTAADNQVAWRDYCFNEAFGLELRLYKPPNNNDNGRLPLVVFLRGGGFCIGSRKWLHIHATCMHMASMLGVAVVCPDYRMGPEYRLPDPIEDVVDAIKWLALRRGEQPLIDVNFDHVYVVGDSSGGNIAHHLAVRFGRNPTEIRPVRIRGYVLLGPFFGGEDSMPSELSGTDNMDLNTLKKFWELSLPDGATMDHEYANPMTNLDDLQVIDKRMLVIVGGYEILKDRAVHYARTLRHGYQKNVRHIVYPGLKHGFFSFDAYTDVAYWVLERLAKFIHGDDFILPSQ